MNSLIKGLILLLIILGIGAGLVVRKNKVGHAGGPYNKITKGEIEMLLADVGKANPLALKRLSQEPEMRKEQLENLQQLLAFASEAHRMGMTNEPDIKQELENIRSEVIAVNYDREINKEKGPMPPFGFISEDRVKQFWGEGEAAPTGFWASFKDKIGLGPSRHEAEFERFLNSKIAIMKKNNPMLGDREISEEERNQARDFFAKIEIYENEFKDKKDELPKNFRDKVDLQVKLQQAQFLARLYSDKLAEKVKVTDEEVERYMAEHPELNPAEKRTKAEGLLKRAQSGEDFAALANEFSDDPGNKDPATGQGKGGLYADTPKGRMMPSFEQAALALEPGQISPSLVETDYGFHIVKLEKKGEGKDAAGQPTETYDVRHILVSTTYKDPDSPMSRDMPVKDYVRAKLEEEKQKKLIDEIVARNHIEVPEDFDVPEVSDEQIQQMMQQQMQQRMPGDGDDGQGDAEAEAPPAKAEPKKPAPKKK